MPPKKSTTVKEKTAESSPIVIVKWVTVSIRDSDGDGLVTSVPVGTRYDTFCAEYCILSKTKFVSGPHKGLNPQASFQFQSDSELTYDDKLYL